MWPIIVKLATKLAVYAAEHPDQVKAVVDDIVAARAK